MKVSIVNHTPDPLKSIIKAARRCYSADDDPQFDERKDPKEFIKFLLDRGHHTPFEFVSVTFSVTGISRACSHQIVRHRLASYCQQSQRYCKGFPGYVLPEKLCKKLESGSIRISNALINFFQSFNYLQETLAEEGISQEDARYFWIEGTKTKMFMKLNLRSLMNFFKLRLDEHAQWEIRKMAGLMYDQICVVLPEVFPPRNLK